MNKKRNWRVIFTWLLLAFSVMYVLPSVVSVPDWYPFQKTLRGGLDLEGGLELRYQVVWEKAIEDTTGKIADGVRARVAEELATADNKSWGDLDADARAPYLDRTSYEVTEMNIARLTFADEEAYDVISGELLTEVDDRVSVMQADGLAYDLLLPDKQWVEIRDRIVNETRDGIEKRVEGMGLLDPDVRVAGEADIMVQIPGLSSDEMDLVRQHLGRPAQLRFREVDMAGYLTESHVDEFKRAAPRSAPTIAWRSTSRGTMATTKTKSELVRFVRWIEAREGFPDERMFGFHHVEDRDRDGALVDSYWRPVYLNDKIWLTGGELTRATATLNERNQPAVSLNLNSEGAQVLADVSDRLSKRTPKGQFAIMLDDDIVSVPFFEEKIPSGRAQITMGSGGRSEGMREARALSDVLNNGSYQAPVYKVADNEVGPSLGADQVSAGATSLLLGLALVVAFMILYYRVSGVIAVSVLLFNVLLIMTLLVSFNAALTLPGIAGIILTIGMAVDANIIVFERIREEIVAGRGPRAAVDTGYAKALSAILDANITTALAALILLNYTSGTIQNFAVTLLMGIVCSVFTAVIVARMLFEYWLAKKKPTELSI